MIRAAVGIVALGVVLACICVLAFAMLFVVVIGLPYFVAAAVLGWLFLIALSMLG